MVKIRELSDKQLLSQIEKYEKIYHQLITERDKRVANSGNEQALLTAKEKAKKAKEAPAAAPPQEEGEDTQAFHLKFDDADLNQMEESMNESKPSEQQEEQDSVTQLLRLSKDQLAELQNPQPKKVVKKKKVLKKKG